MLEREDIVERIKSLPEESLKEVMDFIEFLAAKALLTWRRGTINMSMDRCVFVDTWAWLALSNFDQKLFFKKQISNPNL